ncbi:F-box only protein 15 isoform X1 [Haplochromis burtoni]|uniref:F-box only protein 15 isoform X1 n=1 Tax=Haplochromis burtoni TaxID=8153 RepID=UPI0003BDA9E7|nr:F-box only protein 15 isoform X1 [Haplochromis burtoni]
MAERESEISRSFPQTQNKWKQPVLERLQQGRGRGLPGPRRPSRRQTGGRRWPTSESPNQRQCGGNEPRRCREAPTDNLKAEFPKVNLVERMPSEILHKILSYLDVSSLFCISHVSKLFYQLTNDDVLWYRIYMSEFGWKPKAAGNVAVKMEPAEDRSTSCWKWMYFRMITGREMNKWRGELRDIGPFTGLPQQTERVLRNLNVSWELMLHTHWGQVVVLEQTRGHYFESSMIVHWSGGRLPSYQDINSIQLYGVRKEKLAWRSLILNLDMRTHPYELTGKDGQIRLACLSPGVVIGFWRGRGNIAFIMINLHFHKLVEKILLGSPICPYSEPLDPPPVDDRDPKFGLHGYTLHFVLHNTRTQIMSGHFCQLSCSTIQQGLAEMKVISRTNVSQHRSLSGSIHVPWKWEKLEGSVENCCVMTLTLLDEFQKPFWCVSTPVTISVVKKSQSLGYSGTNFLMVYRSSEGQVKMKLVRLKEQQQFFLVGLTLYVSILKVNAHFSTKYKS